MTAYEIAKKFHAGQKYGDGDYFQTHILDVAKRVDGLHYSFVTRSIAYLHDVLEDCDITEQELRNLLREGDELWADTVVDAVLSLTKKNGEDYETYMQRVVSNHYAVIVKYCDSESNMFACVEQGNYKWAKKYLKNMCFLRKHLF